MRITFSTSLMSLETKRHVTLHPFKFNSHSFFKCHKTSITSFIYLLVNLHVQWTERFVVRRVSLGATDWEFRSRFSQPLCRWRSYIPISKRKTRNRKTYCWFDSDWRLQVFVSICSLYKSMLRSMAETRWVLGVYPKIF